MLGVTDLWTYVLGTIAVILLPGPNSLFVLATAARRGVADGYRAASGVFVGDAVLMALSAAGVASLLEAYPPLFMVIKYVGAAYLGWIGIGMLRGAWRRWRAADRSAADHNTADRSAADRSAADRSAVPADPADLPGPTGTGLFRRALTVSLLNPKAILFFVSFFIQFVDPTYPYPVLSFLLLGAIATVTSAAYLTTLIFAGTYLAAQFRRRRRLAAGMTSGVGALFLGFGVRLATATVG